MVPVPLEHHQEQPCSAVLFCWFFWGSPAFSPSPWQSMHMEQDCAVLSFIKARCLQRSLPLLKKRDSNVHFLESFLQQKKDIRFVQTLRWTG
ncbi:uncharacterized protein LOC124387974 isoform X6 [Silurus meridionalis]|uniref:uncharacterized protein LOC124387974 isoform X6 n=1 Tax=Silurus meridionalis TaxID=175797 RepID=UPI001EEB17DB|nr:uncharacterized protein LOC124387974 isoform X6 [Silurus meridionalis]